jgi:hAT family C-terminal dimerisation region
MASSVSSERAFSAAGITICKRRNRLDGDIVEALQCLKSLIQQDLMVREVLSIADEEAELDFADEQPANQDYTTTEIVNAADDMFSYEASDGEGIVDIDGTEMEIDLTGCES